MPAHACSSGCVFSCIVPFSFSLFPVEPRLTALEGRSYCLLPPTFIQNSRINPLLRLRMRACRLQLLLEYESFVVVKTKKHQIKVGGPFTRRKPLSLFILYCIAPRVPLTFLFMEYALHSCKIPSVNPKYDSPSVHPDDGPSLKLVSSELDKKINHRFQTSAF